MSTMDGHSGSSDAFEVAMVVRLFDPWVGGMERQAMKLASELARRGSRVEILTGRWYRSTPRAEVRSRVLITRHHTLWNGTGVRGLRRLGGLAYMASLAWHLWRRRRRLDVIHVHGLSYHAFVASVLGRRMGIPVIVKLANSGSASDIGKMRAGQHLPFTRLMLPAALRADRLVALNDLVESELIAAGVSTSRIVRIPNGVEMLETRQSYALGPVVRILYIGRLHPQKGIDVLLRAIAALRNELPTRAIELHLVGDGPERDALADLSDRLGLGEHVHFEGLVTHVAPHLHIADVLVLPSMAEGLSNTLLEAMSSGLPVVASDIVANRTLIEHEVNGMLFAKGDPTALRSVLEQLLGDEDLRERVGGEGRQTVESDYSIDHVASVYERLYGALLDRAGRP